MSESPLRQQIAEAIHKWLCDACVAGPPEWHCEPDDISGDESRYFWAADAVVALLNLTEEWGSTGNLPNGEPDLRIRGGLLDGGGVCPEDTRDEAEGWAKATKGHFVTRYVTPWLPSTPEVSS